MNHAFVDIDDKTMCSRCGNEVSRVDEECPSVSDGRLYASVHQSCGCVFCDLNLIVLRDECGLPWHDVPNNPGQHVACTKPAT